MPNPEISKITLPSGTTYDIKDSKARQDIADIKTDISGAMHYVGITTTVISDGSTTATLVIDNKSISLPSLLCQKLSSTCGRWHSPLLLAAHRALWYPSVLML